MKNLVNWAPVSGPYTYDTPFEGYANTGEGGLFAWAVVRETLDNEADGRADGGCCVDVHAVLSFPDVQVSGPVLWDNDGTYGFSESVVAAVFLGATSDALVTYDGEYFGVTEANLTDEGKAVVQALSALGKVDILTFLDT